MRSARTSTNLHPVTRYALEAVQGQRLVGASERDACLRHLKDLARAGQLPAGVRVSAQPDPDFPYRFDEAAADRILAFFSYLHHVEGPLAGKPIELIPAHQFDLGSIFGWVHKKTGVRRFKKAYIQVARKNAKTLLLAGVANYMMAGDREEGPAVYCAAVDKKQARVLYRAAMTMARKSPDLRKRLKIRDYEISHVVRGGQMTPLSRETKNKDGLNPSCAIIDEYHAHPTSEIYDVISSAKGQRAQPLIVIITTAGMDTESPCYKEYLYCKDILTGRITGDQASERYFVMIRELDPDDDEHDASLWVKANPLRVTIPESLVELHEQHDEAFSSNDPAKIRTFRVKNLNLWVHGNEDSYMGPYMVGDGMKPSRWAQLAVPRAQFIQRTQGLLTVVGVDLSKLIDLTALAFTFALPDGVVGLCAHGFMPEATVTRHEKTDRIPYRDWAAAGWLTITPGEVTSEKALIEYIQAMEAGQFGVPELKDKDGHPAPWKGWQIHEICYDPYNATHLMNEMADLGYTTIEVRQTMPNLNEPTKKFRDLVADGKLVHDGSPLLTWCVGNAVQIVDTKENVMLSKKNAGDVRRIDLLAAGIDALQRLQPLQEYTGYGDYVKSDDFGL